MSDEHQFGAATVIGREVRLILLDCFETLVELTAEGYRPRRGVRRFLDHFVGQPTVRLAVVSDADPRALALALLQAGLPAGGFHGIYHAGNAAEPLPGGKARKRLDVPLRDFAVPAEATVFIGDSPLDAEAARHHGVPFIRIPRSEDRGFSLDVLLHGPSRYRSTEFSAHLLKSFGIDPQAKP